MGDWKERLENTKRSLNEISPTMCLAKWLQVTIHFQNGFNHSCHHPAVHKIPLEELKENPSALHNTLDKKLIRKEMIEGKRPEECHYCWRIEDSADSAHYSDRITKSSDEWAINCLSDSSKITWHDDIIPTYLEVSFGNECNFKCAYCSPDISSTIYHEFLKYGDYPNGQYHSLEGLIAEGKLPCYPADNNPYLEVFWSWWKEISTKLHVFRITGGEPLINPHTFKVLRYLKKHHPPKLELSINSNFCVPDSKLDLMISEVDELLEKKAIWKFRAFASVDTYGKQAEYIRCGMDYQKFWDNLRKYLTKLPRAHLTFMCTFNLFSVPRFTDFLKDVLEFKKEFEWDIEIREREQYPRIFLDISNLNHPSFLSLKVLPLKWVGELEKSLSFMRDNSTDNIGIKGFDSYEINKLDRMIQWFKKDDLYDLSLRENRKSLGVFLDEYDRRKGLNFLETFPEFTEFYNDCKAIVV